MFFGMIFIMQEWRVIEDEPKDGESNMAIDRAVLTSCELGLIPPTLRLYSWETPTMTVGYAQDFLREVDVNRCQNLGVQIVRRPTGGRALLHNHEVTYSFTAPIPHPIFPSSLLGAHKIIARALVEGLKEIGVNNATLALREERDKNHGTFHSPSCLSSISHFEIEVHGAKLVGSAQRRTKGAFLQQGSILLGLERTLLNSLFKYTTDKNRSRSMEILDNKVITLAECLGKDVAHKEVFQALKRGFSRILQGSWVPACSSDFKLPGFKPNIYRVDSEVV